MTYTATPQQRVQSNKKQLSRISWKTAENHSMADAIKDFFDDNDIDLVRYRKQKENGIKERAGLSIMNDNKLDKQFGEIGRAYYILKGGNKSVVSLFEQGGAVQPMLMAHWYSKHRLCNVWNFRKSQIIRKRYRDYLIDATVRDKKGLPTVDDSGNVRFLMKTCQPVHMVLTLKHTDGYFEGERFYARKLIQFFTEIRRTAHWKKHVYAGEYGLEIKRGEDKKGKKSNGLHIHMHSLVFVFPGVKIEDFKSWLRRKWSKLTGSNMVHFETLYYYDKDSKGKWITELVRLKKNGQWQYVEDGHEIEEDQHGAKWARVKFKVRRKKHYIDPENSTIEQYMKGVMECIKYHFKSDGFKTNGSWDVPLIMEVLNNSRNLRFYSRFGAFYNERLLNFDFTESEEQNDVAVMTEDSIDENDEIDLPEVDNDKEVINPFTYEVAKRDEYRICIVSPQYLEYKKTVEGFPDLYRYDAAEFEEVSDQFSLKDVIRSLCTGKVYEVLMCNKNFYSQ